ncbi:MAG: mycothiol-dependent nitroreductase Rv2466c family protein [Marmoricola sp.]
MDVEVWADPSCPWSWAACTWLEHVSPDRDVSIVIHPFSLKIRRKWQGVEAPSPMAAFGQEQALRVLRVATQIEEGRTRFYAEATRPAWEAIAAGQPPVFDVERALAQADLAQGLATLADDESLDEEVATSMRSLEQVIDGDPTQQIIPVLAMPTAAGRRGFKGPLLDPVPEGEEATALFDALLTVASTPGFRELSRPLSRHSFTMPG